MFDGTYTKMLRAVLSKSWNQHPTKQQIYGHLPPISYTKEDKQQMWDSAGKVRTNSLVTFFYRPLHIDVPVFANQQGLIYYCSVRIQDVVWKDCQE